MKVKLAKEKAFTGRSYSSDISNIYFARLQKYFPRKMSASILNMTWNSIHTLWENTSFPITVKLCGSHNCQTLSPWHNFVVHRLWDNFKESIILKMFSQSLKMTSLHSKWCHFLIKLHKYEKNIFSLLEYQISCLLFSCRI